MKTNVIMIREEDQFEVLQRTKDGFVNATDVVKKFNRVSNLKKDKEVNRFMSLDGTKKFLEEMVNQGILDTPSEGYHTSRANKGVNAGTWMHPILFVKLMMWCSVEFEVMATRIVYDKLIQNRHLAGDNYKKLSASGVRLEGYNFKQVATALQYIVFGKKGKNLRQTATQEQLNELQSLEEKLSFAIDMGYISSYKQLMSELRKIWNEKNTKF